MIRYAAHAVQHSTDGAAATTSRIIDVLLILGADRYAAERMAQVLFQDQVDWWTVLGVTADSPIEKVKAAYLAESRKFHPDYSHGLSESERQSNSERMKALNQAFEAAKDWVSRRRNERYETTKKTTDSRWVDNATEGGPSTTVPDDEKSYEPESGKPSAASQHARDEKPEGVDQPPVPPSISQAEDIPVKWIQIVASGLLVFVFCALILTLSGSNIPPTRIAPKVPIPVISDSSKSAEPSPQMTDAVMMEEFYPSRPPIEEKPAIDELPESSYGRELSSTDFLTLSDYPIHVNNVVYDSWYENALGIPERRLALQYISDGYAYFIDESGRTVRHSIRNITDQDLEKVVRYIGQGTGNFFVEMPEARSWTMQVSVKPVRASLVGVLNRTLVLRWENKREYIFADFDRLTYEDQSYVLRFCR